MPKYLSYEEYDPNAHLELDRFDIPIIKSYISSEGEALKGLVSILLDDKDILSKYVTPDQELNKLFTSLQNQNLMKSGIFFNSLSRIYAKISIRTGTRAKFRTTEQQKNSTILRNALRQTLNRINTILTKLSKTDFENSFSYLISKKTKTQGEYILLSKKLKQNDKPTASTDDMLFDKNSIVLQNSMQLLSSIKENLVSVENALENLSIKDRNKIITYSHWRAIIDRSKLDRKIQNRIYNDISAQVIILLALYKFQDIPLNQKMLDDYIYFLASITDKKNIKTLFSFLSIPFLSYQCYQRIFDQIFMLDMTKHLKIFDCYLKSKVPEIRKASFCSLVLNGYEMLALRHLEVIYKPPLNIELIDTNIENLIKNELGFYLSKLLLKPNREIMAYYKNIVESETNLDITDRLAMSIYSGLIGTNSQDNRIPKYLIQEMKVVLCNIAETSLLKRGQLRAFPVIAVINNAPDKLSKEFLQAVMNYKINPFIKNKAKQILKKYYS